MCCSKSNRIRTSVSRYIEIRLLLLIQRFRMLNSTTRVDMYFKSKSRFLLDLVSKELHLEDSHETSAESQGWPNNIILIWELFSIYF